MYTQQSIQRYGKYYPSLTFSLINKARLHNGSASLKRPRFPNNTARLFKVAATCINNYQIHPNLQ